MITPLVQEYLSAHLQGHRSADDTKQILRLIDENQQSDGPLEAEFDRVLHKVSQKIPGLTLDFDKLLNGDEIECDPLISQGNLALLRLDAIFRQAFAAWTHSGSSLHTIKRIAKPENPATYSDSTQQHIRTEETYPPDAQLLSQVVNITLSGFRIQATITHRRDQLKQPQKSDQPVSRDATRSAFSPQQTNHQPQITSPSTSDIIDHNEILDSDSDFDSDFDFDFDFDDLPAPTEGYMPLLIRGINKVGILKGYDQIEPLTKTQPRAQQAPAKSRRTVGSAVRTEINTTNALAPSPREEELVDPECSTPSASPREIRPEPTHNVAQELREEEPVISELSGNSASPRETYSHFRAEPDFHKRE